MTSRYNEPLPKLNATDEIMLQFIIKMGLWNEMIRLYNNPRQQLTFRESIHACYIDFMCELEKAEKIENQCFNSIPAYVGGGAS